MTYAEVMKRAIRELEWSRDSNDRFGRAHVAEAWVAIAREIREATSSLTDQEFDNLMFLDCPPVDK